MDYSLLTKEEIINGITDNSIYFKKLPIALRDDRDILLKAIEADWGNLSYASARFMDDKEVMLVAISNTGEALSYASERLKDDKEIVLEAVKNYGKALEFVSNRLKNNKKIVLKAIKQEQMSLYYASERLQNIKEFLEILEKTNIADWFGSNRGWYYERMEILANMREKELLEKIVIPSHVSTKKMKF